MKKILFLLIFLFILTPHTLAAEQKTDLIAGKPVTILGCAASGNWKNFKMGGTSSNVTDSDPSTALFMNDSYCVSNSNGFLVELDKPSHLESMSISYKAHVTGLTLRLYFYDEDKNLIYNEIFRKTPMTFEGSQKFSQDVDNVKYVAVANGEAWNTYSIYDFKLFEYQPPPNGVSDLSYESTSNTVEISYKLPSSDNGFSYLKVYKDGELLKDRYTDSTLTVEGLEPEKQYKFDFVSVFDDGTESDASSIVTKTKELEKPDNVSDLDYDFTSTSLKASYKLPAENFSHLEVYKNNTLIKGNLQDSQLEVSDLLPNTKYDFKIVTVGANGAKSDGVRIQFETPEQHDPPSKPTGLYMDNGNGALTLSWNRNPEKDIEGYNVYLDGKKLNSGLISNTFYTVGHLKNGSKYQMSVEAVNTSKLVSDKADTMGYPNVKGMPLIENDYSLVDVTNGVSVWFGSIWLILAFAVSIPLAFYISHRVKALFFP